MRQHLVTVSNLEKVNMPANLEKIGESAFSQCARLLEIKIPDSVTEIRSNAFYDCALVYRK